MSRKKIFLLAFLLLNSVLVYAAWSDWKKILKSVPKNKPKTATIVAGVRGLDTLPEGRGDNSSRDWEALKKVESYSLPEEELEKFISAGELK